MQKKLFFLSFLLLASLGAAAQETSANATSTPYLCMVEFGYLYQDNTNNAFNTASTSPTFSFFNGYQFHRMFALGLTTGLDFYNTVLITPLSLGIRGHLSDKRFSPMYSLDAGYGTTWLSDESSDLKNWGGWMLNPALGFRVLSGNDTALTMGLGYRWQRATTEARWWNNNRIENDMTFKRLSVRMGFLF